MGALFGVYCHSDVWRIKEGEAWRGDKLQKVFEFFLSGNGIIHCFFDA